MNNTENKKLNFLISGYYGHNNFGDETILSSIMSELKNKIPHSHITVISNFPEHTKNVHQADSVYKYNLPGILSRLFSCDVFISGGGSLLQDVTSFKSLCYYLFLLVAAGLLNKKTFIYAQGIGPLKSRFSRFLTTAVLKNVNFITVRDKKSAKILNSMGIKSTVTADPVWTFNYNPDIKDYTGVKIGIQLRKWPYLDTSRLEVLSDAIISNFSNENTELQLMSLQHPGDTEILKKLREILLNKGYSNKITIFSEMNVEKAVDYMSNLDYIIAMRYHAALIAVKYSVPAFVLSYDPKVTILSEETSLPYIEIENMNFEVIDKNIKYIVSKKDEIKASLQKISTDKNKKAGKNIKLLQGSCSNF